MTKEGQMVEGTVSPEPSYQSSSNYLLCISPPLHNALDMCKDTAMHSLTAQVQDRTRQIIQNLEAVLKGANMTLKNVVKANIYLSDLAKDFTTMNEVSHAFWDRGGSLTR
jgi:enamine deaminase RidA (YjgF/YER057c/UK114 family)